MIKVNLVYECPVCGERELVGPMYVKTPTLPTIGPVPELFERNIWHQCFTKAGLNIQMWGVCKFIGVRGIDIKNKKKKDEDPV